MTNFTQLKNILIYGEATHLEKKIGRFKFLALQGYQVKDASRCKKKKIKFYYVCKRIT